MSEKGKVIERTFKLLHFGAGTSAGHAVTVPHDADPRPSLASGETGLFIGQPQVPYRVTAARSGVKGVSVIGLTKPLLMDAPDWHERPGEMPIVQIAEIVGMRLRNDTGVHQRVCPWFEGVGISDNNPDKGETRKHWPAHFLLGTLPYAVTVTDRFVIESEGERGPHNVLKAHLPAAGRLLTIDVQLSDPAAEADIICNNVIVGRVPGICSADAVPLQALRDFDFSRAFGPLAVSQVLALSLMNCSGKKLEARIEVRMLIPDVITPEHAELRSP